MHTHHTTVRLSHTDASGRIFYSRLFELAHEALEELLTASDHPIARLCEETLVGLPVVHAEVDFKVPLRTGDRLAISVAPERLGKSSFTLLYRVNLEQGPEAAVVRTVHVAVDASTGTKMDLPAPFRAALERAMLPG
jgi:1,4-dihydroxy-2-naphthoyl-CoA hydrolase